MNSIYITDNVLENTNLDDSIVISELRKDILNDVDHLTIDILSDTYLYMNYQFANNNKLNIVFNINESVDFLIYEEKKGFNSKIKNEFNLNKDSTLTVNKFYDVDAIKEMNIVNLNGDNAKVDYIFKTIAKNPEKYDFVFNHNSSNTISNINNAGVSISDGEISFDITSVVPFGKKNCIVNQESRIINLNDKNSTINPNLLIEDNDIVANHGAFIGKFSDEELFYLMSRGIEYNSAINLLIRGFLKSHLTVNEEQNNKIDKIINSYWR